MSTSDYKSVRVPVIPLDYNSRFLAEKKEILFDYNTGQLYVVSAEDKNVIFNITDVVLEKAKEGIDLDNLIINVEGIGDVNLSEYIEYLNKYNLTLSDNDPKQYYAPTVKFDNMSIILRDGVATVAGFEHADNDTYAIKHDNQIKWIPRPDILNAAPGVTGILPEANGGTGQSNLGNVTVGCAEALSSWKYRPTTANNTFADTRVRYYIASSSMITAKPPSDGAILHLPWDSGSWDTQLFISDVDATVAVRAQNGVNDWSKSTGWKKLAFADDVPVKNGTGASGTWGINITGTATKATQDGNGANIADTYLKKAGDTVTGTLNVPTQATTDNSTKVANTAFVQSAVDNKVSQLVNSAPETLDTLNELSNVLGNDPNFATTVTNMIGQKLNKAGDTITGPILYSNTPNGDTELPNKAYVDSAINSAVVAVTQTLSDNMHAQYPVGSYIYSDKADNPATYLPYMSDTTWVQTAAGRVLIGAGTADSGTVYTAGQTGGEEKHKLTIDELAAHSHVVYAGYGSTSTAELDSPMTNRNSVSSDRITSSVGGNMPHNNMEPYKVVYIFKRAS